MKFLINPKVLADHPDMAIGVIITKNLDNTAQDQIAPLLREAEKEVQNSMNLETFKEHPHIKSLQS